MKLIDVIKENQADLGEVVGSRSVFSTLLKGGTGLKTSFKTAITQVLNFDPKNAIYAGTKKKGTLAKLTTADEFINALKNNTIGSKELGKVYSGLFKNPTTGRDFLKILVPDLLDDAVFIRKYSKYADDASLKQALKTAQYSDDAVKEIMAASKKPGNKFGQARANGGVTGGKNKTNPIPPTVNKTLLDRINELRKFSNWPTALKWAAGLGIGAAALWAFCELNGIGFSDMPETQPEDTGEWAECIQKLIKSGEGKIETADDGSVGVVYKGGAYPDGILFTNDGKVKNLSTSEMGTWSCKSGVIGINESKIITLIKGVLNEIKLEEQIDDQLSTDVETMVDLLDFPVSQSDLISAGTLLKQYVDNGKGKAFLELYKNSGLGTGDLRKSLKYIFTSAPKSVQAKQYLNSLISQIEGGGSSSTTDGDKVGLDGIDIIWGGGQDDVTPTPTPRRQFHDCNDKPLPHEFGCKSEQIRKLQKCLGDVKADSAFGPLTKGSLEKRNIDTSNGITQGIIDTVCGSSNTTGTTTTPERTKEEPIKLPVRNPFISPIDLDNLKLPNIEAREATPSQFFNALKDNGNIKGEDGNNRIKYKGPDLNEIQLSKLDSALSSLGYTRIKQLEDIKRYGSKYVWLKQQ
jgi:hypothetical protein